MHKPVANMFTVRQGVSKERMGHIPKEDLEKLIQDEATIRLSREINNSGKFEMKNITQEEIERHKMGLYPFREYLLDNYYGEGIEYFEARVFVFTPEELEEYMDSVVKEAIKDKLDKLLHFMNQYKG